MFSKSDSCVNTAYLIGKLWQDISIEKGVLFKLSYTLVAVLQDESFFSYMRKIKPWIDA